MGVYSTVWLSTRSSIKRYHIQHSTQTGRWVSSHNGLHNLSACWQNLAILQRQWVVLWRKQAIYDHIVSTGRSALMAIPPETGVWSSFFWSSTRNSISVLMNGISLMWVRAFSQLTQCLNYVYMINISGELAPQLFLIKPHCVYGLELSPIALVSYKWRS